MLPSQSLFWGVLTGIFFWLLVLSLFLWRTVSHYRKLTQGVTKKHLDKVLEKILKEQVLKDEKIDKLYKKIDELENKGSLHIQKIGLVRFNPFSDTGGNQSFTLALLDGQDNGFVLSTLHSRDQTRIYAKPVEKGKSQDFSFSKEEKEALKRAKKVKVS